MGTPQRTLLTTADGTDLSNIPAEVTDNLITCGDKQRLVCFAQFMDTNAGQHVKITPIFYDNEGVAPANIIGCPWDGNLQANYSGYEVYQTSQGGRYIASTNFWDTVGAYKVGLMVASMSLGGGSTGVNIWGFMI